MNTNLSEELNSFNPSLEDIAKIENETVEADIKGITDTDMLDSIQIYLYSVGKIPMLSKEEEIELGKIIKDGGERAIEARNKLVESNLRLVMYYAKKYRGSGVELEDLNSMGTLGLIKAAEKFDYTLGYRFSTYATWWINQAIRRSIADESSVVRIPVHMGETINKVKKAKKMLFQETGKEPSIEEIACFCGLSNEAVMSATKSMYNVVSIDARVGEERETTLENYIIDENNIDPDEVLVNENLREDLNAALCGLGEREKKVLVLRYGLENNSPMTLDEIAKLPEFNVTRERIRQIEAKAIRKIRRSSKVMNLLIDYVA